MSSPLAVILGFALAYAALAVWSSWVVDRHRAVERMCCDCRHRLALKGVTYCGPCEKVRVARGTAEVDAAIARGDW